MVLTIKMVSTECDPFTIIDRCIWVATSGGTTALEGVAREKPALLFGNAWYRDCPGVHRVNSIGEVKALLEQSPNKLACQPQDFANFVEAISKGGFRGVQ